MKADQSNPGRSAERLKRLRVRAARPVSARRAAGERRLALVLRPLLASTWLGLGALGCDEPLMERALLEGPRVLGVRVEVVSSPARASVAPGEEARVDFLVAEPGRPAEVSWSFTVCAADRVVRDAPTCAAPPFAEAESAGVGAAAPSFTFTMPGAAELVGADEVLVSGAFCFGSEMRAPSDGTDFLGYRCSGGGKPELVATNVVVERDGTVNGNPDLEAAAWSFDGEPWAGAPTDASYFSGCDGLPSGLPRVGAGSAEHVISITVPEGEREKLDQLSSKAQSRETYQLSHVVSAGALERPFSVIDDLEPAPELVVHWDAPRGVPREGLVVRFFFVARDLRGGADFAVGAVCVEPG